MQCNMFCWIMQDVCCWIVCECGDVKMFLQEKDSCCPCVRIVFRIRITWSSCVLQFLSFRALSTELESFFLPFLYLISRKNSIVLHKILQKFLLCWKTICAAASAGPALSTELHSPSPSRAHCWGHKCNKQLWLSRLSNPPWWFRKGKSFSSLLRLHREFLSSVDSSSSSPSAILMLKNGRIISWHTGAFVNNVWCQEHKTNWSHEPSWEILILILLISPNTNHFFVQSEQFFAQNSGWQWIVMFHKASQVGNASLTQTAIFTKADFFVFNFAEVFFRLCFWLFCFSSVSKTGFVCLNAIQNRWNENFSLSDFPAR